MRGWFQQGQQKCKSHKEWVFNVIAAPVLLTMVVWPLADRNLPPKEDQRLSAERATLPPPHHDLPSGELERIAVFFGVIFLLIWARSSKAKLETANFCGANLNGSNFCGADLSGADFNGASLCGADFRGANLSGATLSGANLSEANLRGATLSGAGLRYANLSGADLRYTDLRDSDLRHANLSYADLNCAFLRGANLSDANLRGALLILINLRDVLNLEPLQLQAKPSPFLCNVALPDYSQHPRINPNCACHGIPQVLSDHYAISLREAEEIVSEARQYRWDESPAPSTLVLMEHDHSRSIDMRW